MVSAILVCAGKGLRAGFGFNKLLKDTGDGTPFEKCLKAFAAAAVDEIIVVCSEEDEEAFGQKALSLGVDAIFTRGGETRSLSVKNGVNAANGDIVVIHDGARPFVSVTLIDECVRSARLYGSGIAAIPSPDTICYCEDGENATSSFRKGYYLVQTPQAFVKTQLEKAFSLKADGEEFTDESGLYEKYIGACRLVKGDASNRKLTFREDFSTDGNLFCGTGFDLHRLVSGRKLILGGVEIPFEKGLLGHSDADVLTHAIMDALLSSAALGDIGKLFPDTDPRYEGANSMKLLEKVLVLLEKSGYKPKNVTAVIMAQRPKLSKYVPEIQRSLALALGIPTERVGITCTTLEGIGTVGREEGIAVQAYVLTTVADASGR
ncbi:MAG: 2-C-methyl-D-erythritol 2,4-cyclodiphosphate synthase [Clostridia bacterium]|nr:2-C-methyl-D-erythritol 2,4-cyclodiphosphate synthase [Clostridia bacterium]